MTKVTFRHLRACGTLSNDCSFTRARETPSSLSCLFGATPTFSMHLRFPGVFGTTIDNEASIKKRQKKKKKGKAEKFYMPTPSQNKEKERPNKISSAYKGAPLFTPRFASESG